MYWIVKDNLDGTYTPIKSISEMIGEIAPDHTMVIGPDIALQYAKAELINGKIVVSKDQSIHDADNTRKENARQSFKDLKNIDWADTTNQAKLKAIVRNQNKVILHLARMLRDQ